MLTRALSLREYGDVLSRPAELERVCEGRGKEVTQAQAKLQSLTHDVAQANQRLQDAEGQEKVRFKRVSTSHDSRIATYREYRAACVMCSMCKPIL